jgi:hypothetical protein
MISGESWHNGYCRLVAVFPFLGTSNGREAVYAEALRPIMDNRTWEMTVMKAIYSPDNDTLTVHRLVEMADSVRLSEIDVHGTVPDGRPLHEWFNDQPSRLAKRRAMNPRMVPSGIRKELLQ